MIPAVDAILPLCLSSYRTSFVNLYSSVRVRPDAPAFAWTPSNREGFQAKDVLHRLGEGGPLSVRASKPWMAGQFMVIMM